MRYAWTFLIACILGTARGPVSLAANSLKDGPATRATDLAATQPQPQYWFGVAVENIPPAFTRLMKLKPRQGLIVLAVMHDSPADRARLKPDDLLLEINGSVLTSQEDLARAANTSPIDAVGSTPSPSMLKYCRDGDYVTVAIQPAPRPTDMRVSGGNLGSFSLSARKFALQPQGLKPFNYVLPNGGAAQVGPGYRINLDGSDFAVKSIREVVSKGQTLVLSQETDAAGLTHNTITVGDKVYAVEPGQLDTLPPDLRLLGEQLLAHPQPQDDGGAATATTAPANAAPKSAEQQRIIQLEKQLDEANLKLKKIQSGGAGASGQ